jgi:HSP90 family molecular chaperone
MLEVNTSLICLDIDRNPKMKLESVRRIQEALKRNKKTYDDQRYKEFYERKKMWNEENISEILHTQVEGKRMA